MAATTGSATGTTTTTQPRTWSAARIVVAVTAASVAVHLLMELGVVLLRPEMGADFLVNVASVLVMSAVGLAVTLGLVRLGQTGGRRRTVLAWVLALLALPAVALFYFLALPATLAAGGFALARDGGGSLRAARIVAIVGVVASFLVSIAMLFTYL